MKTKQTFLAAALILLGLSACNKNDDAVIGDENVALAQELMSSEVMDSQLSASINSAILLSERSYSSSSTKPMSSKSTSALDCGELTINPLLGFPKTITINFGEGCVDSYGISRSGMIAITISNYLASPGAEYSVLFTNFAVNGYRVSGTFAVENTGTLSQPAFAEDMDLIFTGSDGTSLNKIKSVERTWIEGASTESFADDVYQITGSADVISSRGYYYSYDITSPLKLEYGCDPITEGIIVLDIYGQDEPITIDFGDGTCDWKAKLSQPGKGETELSFGE